MTETRVIEKLVRDMGDLIPYLHDEAIQEVMLNSNGELWVESSRQGMRQAGLFDSQRATAIIHGMAGLMGKVVSNQQPLLEVEFPMQGGLKGERFTAQLPPVVLRPSFTIRKKSKRIYTLADYVATGRLSIHHLAVIQEWIKTRKNILVAGSPGSGKTTVINALIEAVVALNPNERLVLLEDVPELQCSGHNQLSLFTSPQVSMRDLLYTAVRSRPDRIVVGEVRGAEALDLLKAWNIGCLGGMGTLHANGTKEATQRLMDLTVEGGLVHPPINLIRQTVQAILFVDRKGNQNGFITDLAVVTDYVGGQFKVDPI
jgi:P-type conjugative transfer ATPase TrbB